MSVKLAVISFIILLSIAFILPEIEATFKTASNTRDQVNGMVENIAGDSSDSNFWTTTKTVLNTIGYLIKAFIWSFGSFNIFVELLLIAVRISFIVSLVGIIRGTS